MISKEKLFEKTKTNKVGCIIWNKSVDQGGYGKLGISINGKQKMVAAHRLSYELHKGPIPLGMLVCHTCDMRRCINPDHLFLGTHKDNSQDAVRKGRIAKNDVKLTPRKVQKIKELYNTGEWTHRGLAEKFGVCKSTIWDILNSNHWKENETKVSFYRPRDILNLEKVREIRSKYKTGKYFQRELGKEYGVSQTTIWEIVTNRTWQDQ